MITPYMLLYAVHDALLKPMPGNPITPSACTSPGLTASPSTAQVYDEARFLSIWELTALHASGPRGAVSGLDFIPLFAYSGPYEDVQLKS